MTISQNLLFISFNIVCACVLFGVQQYKSNKIFNLIV